MIALGDCRFDPEKAQLFDSTGQLVRLRNKSLRTLAVLAEAEGRIVPKDEIIARVWDQPFVSDESLSQCIGDIRRALQDTRRDILQTLPGQGFLLAGRPIARTAPGELPSVLIETIEASAQDDEASLVALRIAQEVLRAISRRKGVRVRSRTDGDDPSDYRIRGSVRRHSNALSVFMEIDEVRGRGLFYTETFEPDDETAEEFANRVARKVTNVQRVSAIANFGQRLLHIPDQDLDLQQLLQKAAYHYSKITTEATEAARQVLSVAIDRYPDSAMAHAMQAATYVHMYPLTAIDRSDDRVATAMELAERAVFAGPEVDFCLRTRGNLKFWLLRDHEGAINDCNRALAITPNYQLAHLTRLQSELFSGDWQAARHRLDRQIEVDIALPQYHYFQTLHALCALAAGDEDAARTHAREAYEYAPWSDWGVLVLAAAYADETDGATTGIADRIARNRLTPAHFRDLPIRDEALLALLTGRAERAGL